MGDWKSYFREAKKRRLGLKVIDRLSIDLTKNFPEMKGFSLRNLKYMRKFAEEYPDISIVQEPLAQITWYHNKIVKSIPKNLKPSLPSIKDIE